MFFDKFLCGNKEERWRTVQLFIADKHKIWDAESLRKFDIIIDVAFKLSNEILKSVMTLLKQ